jgi:hypothetical protein
MVGSPLFTRDTKAENMANRFGDHESWSSKSRRSELVSDTPSNPGLEIDHLIELLRAHFFSARQIPNQSGPTT